MYDPKQVNGMEFRSQGYDWKVTGVTPNGQQLLGQRVGGSEGTLPLNRLEHHAVDLILEKKQD